MPERVFDKAKYHVGRMGEGVPDAQAFVHGGMLLAWLAERRLLDPALARLVRERRKAEGRVGPAFEDLADGVLDASLVNEEGAAFLTAYLGPDEDEPSVAVGVDLGISATWWEDLEALEAETGGPYTTPDDDTSFARFCARLDERLKEWRRAGSPVAERQRSEDPRVDLSLVPRERVVELVALGVPAPWPAPFRVAVWRPDTAAQREAACRITGEWMALVPTEAPEGVVTEPGRIALLARVEEVAEDGAWVALHLPALGRARVLGPADGGRARVEVLPRQQVPPNGDVRARVLVLEPDFTAWSGDAAAVVADRVGWPRVRDTADLRALVDAVDPIRRLEVALRLFQRAAR